jgi:hypothetical protein
MKIPIFCKRDIDAKKDRPWRLCIKDVILRPSRRIRFSLHQKQILPRRSRRMKPSLHPTVRRGVLPFPLEGKGRDRGAGTLALSSPARDCIAMSFARVKTLFMVSFDFAQERPLTTNGVFTQSADARNLYPVSGCRIVNLHYVHELTASNVNKKNGDRSRGRHFLRLNCAGIILR